MRLKSVRVNEFKSVRDSGEFETGDVTCLVGKNEAGKTAVLEALYRLHPIIDSHSTFDVTHDYPRGDVEDYQHAVQSGIRKQATVITALFELTPEEIATVENDFGHGAFINNVLKLWRGYDNSTHFDLSLDEAVVARHLAGEAELSDEVRAQVEQARNLKELQTILGTAASAQDKAHKAALAAADALDEADKAKATDEANRLQESASAKQLRAAIPTYLKEGFKNYIWTGYVADNFPKFLYFDEYYQMEGQVNIQRLKERQANGTLTESDRPMLGLIDLARLDVDQLLAAKDTQALLNKIEGASNHLSMRAPRHRDHLFHAIVISHSTAS